MADYPREIKLDEDTEQRLIRYLEDELSRHYAERGSSIDNLQMWQSDYWAEPSTSEATFPFRGAATIIIPLAAITVEAIHARVMTTMFALSQFITAKPTSPKWTEHARPVERFLDHKLLREIGIYKPINSSVLEIIKFGTGVAKCGYEKITKTAVREMSDDKEEEFTVTIKNSATVDSVPFARFLMPFIYQDPQSASWCGEEHEYTPYAMRQMETSGMFAEGTIEKMNAHFNSNPTDNAASGGEFQHNQETLEQREPIWPERLQTVEIWCGFDVDNTEKLVVDGMVPRESVSNTFDKEIVVHYHRQSRTILSLRYNPYEDLRRPYHTGTYFPVEHRWTGIGVCKQVEQFQKEITTQHRQRIDNATLANCRMLKVSSLSKYGPDEPIFPGKIWFVDNENDVSTFQLGEIYPSAYSNENQSNLYVQQRTGVNEVNLGMPQVGTPGTATSDLARIQEGNKKFDYTYRNIKHFVSEVSRSTVLNIKQFGTRAETYYMNVEGGELVKEFFNEDFQLIKEGLLLEISVAGQQDNKLLDRNNWQQVAQLLTGYYDSMLGLAKAKGDQQMMELIINNGMHAATETMKQILESFDLKNVDRIIVQEALQQNGGLKKFATLGEPEQRSPDISAPEGMVSSPNGIPQTAGY